MERACPVCGEKVSRKRGNLKPQSWRNALQRLLEVHVRKKHGISLEAAEKGKPWTPA